MGLELDLNIVIKTVKVRFATFREWNHKNILMVYDHSSSPDIKIQGVPELRVPKQTLITFLFFDLET